MCFTNTQSQALAECHTPANLLSVTCSVKQARENCCAGSAAVVSPPQSCRLQAAPVNPTATSHPRGAHNDPAVCVSRRSSRRQSAGAKPSGAAPRHPPSGRAAITPVVPAQLDTAQVRRGALKPHPSAQAPALPSLPPQLPQSW